MIKVYTTGCPKCHVLEAKLVQKNIEFEEIMDIPLMERLGIDMIPMLEIEEGKLLPFADAVKWINEYTGENK
jgi:hypothetical protein